MWVLWQWAWRVLIQHTLTYPTDVRDVRVPSSKPGVVSEPCVTSPSATRTGGVCFGSLLFKRHHLEAFGYTALSRRHLRLT